MDTFLALIGLLVIVSVIVLIVFAPVLTIISINALFGLSTPVTVGTYFSVVWIAIFAFLLLK